VLKSGPICALFLVVPSSGSGSDIGPEIPEVRTSDYRVVVHDDADRPVSGALVSLLGPGGVGATGRMGRARIDGQPSGSFVVQVDGSNGSARAGDSLALVSVLAPMPDGGELPYVVHLPDLGAAASVAAGVVPASFLVDGALTVPAGTSVGFGAAATVALRTGTLSPRHLPGELPLPSSGARLWSGGTFVDPPAVTFSPGAALSRPNDLALPAGAAAELFRLEPQTGVWNRVASGIVNGAGTRIDAPAGAVQGGGLLAFAVESVATTVLSGRVVDVAGRPVWGALLRVPSAHSRTLSDGSFVLPAIAATDGSGAARSISLEVDGGLEWRPSGVTSALTLAAGTQVLADVVLETTQVSTVRLQLINRGRIDPFRRLRASVSDSPSFGLGVGDGQARVDYADMTAGSFVGVLTSRVKDVDEVFLSEALTFVPLDRTNVDLQVFTRESPWWSPRSRNGSTATVVVDEMGTGMVRFAAVVQGSVPGTGLVGFTNDNGIVNAGYGKVGQGTAALTSSATGLTKHAAFSMVDIDSQRIEIPIERAQPSDGGAFDPHGLVRGQLLSATAGKIHRVRATRLATRQDWFEEVFLGQSVLGDVPLEKDPDVAPVGEFAIGVPTPIGNLAVVEGVAGAAAFTLERAGVRAGFAPAPGVETRDDIDLDLVADTPFAANRALLNLHPSIPMANLAFDWAIEFADRKLVDVVRAVDGNMIASGDDLQFLLPALGGQLSGARHLVALGGRQTSGSGSAAVTVEQRTFIPFEGQAGPVVRFLVVPDILSPAPGAVVSGTILTVQFTVPISTIYTLVELRAVAPGEERVWKAVLPASFDSYTFRELPPQVAQPLVPGLTYQLKVTAARIETGVLSEVTDAYRKILQNWVGIGISEREVNALSSTEITISTM